MPVINGPIKQPLSPEDVAAQSLAHSEADNHGVVSSSGPGVGWWSCQDCTAEGGNVPAAYADLGAQ